MDDYHLGVSSSSCVYPLAGWFIMNKTNLKWMMNRGSTMYGNTQILNHLSTHLCQEQWSRMASASWHHDHHQDAMFHPRNMQTYEGFLSHGGTPSHHPFEWDFPWHKPSSYGGYPHDELETPIYWVVTLAPGEPSTRNRLDDVAMFTVHPPVEWTGGFQLRQVCRESQPWSTFEDFWWAIGSHTPHSYSTPPMQTYENIRYLGYLRDQNSIGAVDDMLMICWWWIGDGILKSKSFSEVRGERLLWSGASSGPSPSHHGSKGEATAFRRSSAGGCED